MRGDSNRLEAAKPFTKWIDALGSIQQPIEGIDVTPFPKSNLFVTFSSDKGLCGGVNSFITRGMRKVDAKLHAQGKDFKLITIGEKGRGQMRRFFESKFVVSLTDNVYPATFSNVSAVTNEVLKVNPSEYEALHLVYNEFKSAISYISTVKTIPTLKGEGQSEPLVQYEFEPSTKAEVLADLKEYLTASSIFYSVMQNAASEQSARTTAMENASKNAGELIGILKLRYNKARQTRITTELIEIISGKFFFCRQLYVSFFDKRRLHQGRRPSSEEDYGIIAKRVKEGIAVCGSLRCFYVEVGNQVPHRLLLYLTRSEVKYQGRFRCTEPPLLLSVASTCT